MKAGSVLVALLTLAVLSSSASPGYSLAQVPKAVGKSIAKALGATPKAPAGPRETGQRGASSFALADIPRRYLDFYTDAAATCHGLTWPVDDLYDELEPSEQVKVYDKGITVNNTETLYKMLIGYRSGDMWAPHLVEYAQEYKPGCLYLEAAL